MGRLEPHRNRGFITLYSFALRFLRTESKRTHEFTDVTRVEVNACHTLADISDALASPAIHGEPPMQRPEFHGIEQLLLIFSADTPTGPRMGFRAQRIRATLEPCRVPFANGGAANLEFTGDTGLVGFVSCEEFSGVLAAFLELRFGESCGFPRHRVM